MIQHRVLSLPPRTADTERVLGSSQPPGPGARQWPGLIPPAAPFLHVCASVPPLLSLAALSSACQAAAKGLCKFRCRERGVWVEDGKKFWGALKSCSESHWDYTCSMDCILSLTQHGLHRTIPAVTIVQPWAMARENEHYS